MIIKKDLGTCYQEFFRILSHLFMAFETLRFREEIGERQKHEKRQVRE